MLIPRPDVQVSAQASPLSLAHDAQCKSGASADCEAVFDCRANAFATRKLQASKGLSGSCLHARSAAACPPCDRQGDANNGCPPGSMCMSPVVSPGDHMFKACYHPSSARAEPRWLPGQASATGRKLMSQIREEEARVAGQHLAALSDRGMERAAPIIVSHLNMDQGNLTESHSAVMTAGTGAQHAQHVFDVQTEADIANAFLIAHPSKDAVKSNATTASRAQLSQELLASSSITSRPKSAAESDPIGDRIGRVALANEHRKVIRQETSLQKELSCPHYLVYVGTSGQLMQALEVSDFVPKSSLVPLQWPHMIEQMLVYTFAVSAALALINMAPIWYLDGEAALSSAIRLRSHSDMFYSSVAQPNRHWGRLLRCVLGVGSGVFVCVLLLHMVRLLGYDAKLGHLLHTLGKLLSFVLT